MKVPEGLGRWLLNGYPPFLFNAVHIVNIGKGFRSCRVRIRRSILNRNMNGTIFGGSLFSAADPFYAIMYWQIFERKGMKVLTWLKTAQIQYLRPANEKLYIDFKLTDEDIEEAITALMEHGRYKKTHDIQFVNSKGEVFVKAQNEVYLRLTHNKQSTSTGF